MEILHVDSRISGKTIYCISVYVILCLIMLKDFGNSNWKTKNIYTYVELLALTNMFIVSS